MELTYPKRNPPNEQSMLARTYFGGVLIFIFIFSTVDYTTFIVQRIEEIRYLLSTEHISQPRVVEDLCFFSCINDKLPSSYKKFNR